MKAFFLKIAHLVQQLDHDVISVIHFLDIVFKGEEIQAAITAVGNGAKIYVDSEFKNAQVREFAASTVLKVVPAIGQNRAYALVSHVMDLADAKVEGLLDHMLAHYMSAVPVTAEP